MSFQLQPGDASIVIYRFNNGAYINGMCPNFEDELALLIVQYGPPMSAHRSAWNEFNIKCGHADCEASLLLAYECEWHRWGQLNGYGPSLSNGYTRKE